MLKNQNKQTNYVKYSMKTLLNEQHLYIKFNQ